MDDEKTPCLAPGLTSEPVALAEYWSDQFKRDLRTVSPTPEYGRPADLSVNSFCPDVVAGAMYAQPAARFQQLPNQKAFLASFFVQQCLAQGTHFTGVPLLWDGHSVVLVGVLAGFGSIQSPAFLLLVLGLYEAAVADKELGTEIATLLRSQPEIQRSARLREALHNEFNHQFPDSLRAFVPYGDNYRFRWDREAVGRWRETVLAALAPGVNAPLEVKSPPKPKYWGGYSPDPSD